MIIDEILIAYIMGDAYMGYGSDYVTSCVLDIYWVENAL